MIKVVNRKLFIPLPSERNGEEHGYSTGQGL